MWTGAYLWDECGQEYGRECVQLTFGTSVNERYGREGMWSLLFFFLISFVASFLLDVLYGVRNKSELCVQVFFERWFWMEFSQRECVLRFCRNCVDRQISWGERTERCCYTDFKKVLCVFCNERFFWGVPYGKRKIFLFTYDQSSYEDKSSLQAMRMCWRGSQKCLIFNVRFL